MELNFALIGKLNVLELFNLVEWPCGWGIGKAKVVVRKKQRKKFPETFFFSLTTSPLALSASLLELRQFVQTTHFPPERR